jgi:hypothetical protein
MATQLNAVSSTLLPPTITGPIFAKASEESAVMRLARRVPLSVSAQTAIPVPMDIPVAGLGLRGWRQARLAGRRRRQGDDRQEGRPSRPGVRGGRAHQPGRSVLAAPAGSADGDRPRVRPGRDQRQGPPHRRRRPVPRLPGADDAARSRSARQRRPPAASTPTSSPAPARSSTRTTTSPASPPTRVSRSTRLLQTDTQGRPLFNDASAASIGGTLAGFPAFFSKGVSGRYWRAGDTTQVVTINGTPTGGTFVLILGRQLDDVAYNAAAATVQTASRRGAASTPP